MFIKATLVSGEVVRINFDKVSDYFLMSSGSGTHIQFSRDDSYYYQVTESPELFDRILGVKDFFKPSPALPEINEQTTLKEVRLIKIANREMFKGINEYIKKMDEIEEPTFKDLLRIVKTGEIRHIRNMGKKSTDDLKQFLFQYFPQHDF